MNKTAQDLMTQPALAISGELSAEEALTFAKMNEIHHLPIEADGNIVGLVCTCDLRDISLKAPASQALKRAPVTVSPDATSLHIAQLMRSECVGSVLVRDLDKWGIVTKEDLLGAQLEDPKAVELIEACRCRYCQTTKHLRRDESDFACVFCLERANHPERFEGGEVD